MATHTVCNIDAHGRRLRRRHGWLAFAASICVGATAIVARSRVCGVFAIACGLGGAIALREARRGWCYARGFGISTRY